MTDRELDVRIDQELREILRRREPGPVPYDLRRRVDQVPASVASRHGVAARLVPVLAAAAAVVVLLVAVPRLGPAPVGPGASPMPSAVPAMTFDPTLVGPGVAVQPATHPGSLVAAAVLLLALAAVVLQGWRRLVPLVPAALLAGWALVASQVPVTVGTMGFGLGLHTTHAEAPPAFDEDVLYETAPAGTPFGVMIFMRAESAVPVTIEGFVEPLRDEAVRGFPVWQAAWLDGELGTAGTTGPATPFEPFVVGPNGQAVHLVGRAGRCAYGPAFDTGNPPPDVAYMGMDRITVQVGTLGWPRTVELALPFDLAEPRAPGDC